MEALWIRRKESGRFAIMAGPKKEAVEVFEVHDSDGEGFLWQSSIVGEPGGLETVLTESIECSTYNLAHALASLIRAHMAEEAPGFTKVSEAPIEIQQPRPGVYRLLLTPALEVVGEVSLDGLKHWTSTGFSGVRKVKCSSLERAVGRLLSGRTKDQAGIDAVVAEITRLEKRRQGG